MNALEEAIATVLDRAVSPAAECGYFGRVQMHEPKSTPGADLTCAIFVQSITPVAAASGLATTSVRLELTARIYKPFKSIPEDLIDINMVMAAAALMSAYSGDFDFGGAVRNVDLLGQFGRGLAANAGYQTVGGTSYRTMDITVPLIISDVFDQEA